MPGMTEWLARGLYRLFLSLHPEPFRLEFGEEMLGIFDECIEDQGAWFVLIDVVRSALRQQVRYHTAQAPEQVPLFWETAESPQLARAMASTVLVLTFAVSAGMSGFKVKPQGFQITSGRPQLFYAPAKVSVNKGPR